MENPLAIANHFIKKSLDTGEELTPMKLVKLVYIAHGWHLGITGEPLIGEAVQAWKYGPVVESVYHAAKRYGNGQIEEAISQVSPDNGLVYINLVDETIEPFLDKIWQVYGRYNGLQLSALTHQEDTPWYITWHKNGGKNDYGVIIPNNIIKDHYQQRISKNAAA